MLSRPSPNTVRCAIEFQVLHSADPEVHDPGLDDLLALDGVLLVVDPLGNHWVKFVVTRVAPSDERPHGTRSPTPVWRGQAVPI